MATTVVAPAGTVAVSVAVPSVTAAEPTLTPLTLNDTVPAAG